MRIVAANASILARSKLLTSPHNEPASVRIYVSDQTLNLRTIPTSCLPYQPNEGV